MNKMYKVGNYKVTSIKGDAWSSVFVITLNTESGTSYDFTLPYEEATPLFPQLGRWVALHIEIKEE